MAELDVAGYLGRLCLDPIVDQPSVAGLRALHRAHVERVPYENVEIALGRSTGVDPLESVTRLIELRRCGYCFHLNGAFSALLLALGYDVTVHVGGVHGPRGFDAAEQGNHAVLLVHGLPDEVAPDGTWYVDVGLGDALFEPVPLVEGDVVQEPFEMRLERSDALSEGWHLQHDSNGAFNGMHFSTKRAAMSSFARRHIELSTSPDSGFVRTFIVQRRRRSGVDRLRGCVFTELDVSGSTSRDVTGRDEWLDVLAWFRIGLEDVGIPEQRAMWRRVRTSHERWDEAGRP